MNAPTNPSGRIWSWEVCAQGGSACAPFASGQSVSTLNASAGSIFRATASDGPTATSPVWLGTVASATAPSVRGEIRANALVRPVAGTWSGSWVGDYDLFQLAACANVDGSACTTLTDMAYPGGCPAGAAVIDPVFTGRHLRVADRRFGLGTVFAASALSSPYGPSVWTADPTTSVAMVGQIAAASGPRASSCGPPPIEQPATAPTEPPGVGLPFACGQSVAHLACSVRVLVTLSKDGEAVVRCPGACRVVLRARHGRRNAQLTRVLPAATSASMGLSARSLRHLRARWATFTVTVDRTTYAHHLLRVSKRAASA